MEFPAPAVSRVTHLSHFLPESFVRSQTSRGCHHPSHCISILILDSQNLQTQCNDYCLMPPSRLVHYEKVKGHRWSQKSCLKTVDRLPKRMPLSQLGIQSQVYVWRGQSAPVIDSRISPQRNRWQLPVAHLWWLAGTSKIVAWVGPVAVPFGRSAWSWEPG
jgi:hypothetical protein